MISAVTTAFSGLTRVSADEGPASSAQGYFRVKFEATRPAGDRFGNLVAQPCAFNHNTDPLRITSILVTSRSDTELPEGRSTLEQQRLITSITTLFEHKITFNEFLGFKIEQLDPTPVRVCFSMRPELIGHFQHGRLHGGVISSVLDVSGGLAVMIGIAGYHASETADQIMQRFTHLATIDMRVDYLRQGIGERFTAKADVVRLGKRVAVCSMRLTNEKGSLIATGNATYMVS